MIHVIIALFLALAPTAPRSLSDLTAWQPIPPRNLQFDTGECITYQGGEPFFWTAAEQCYDGEQQIARATIEKNIGRFAPRRATATTFRVSGKFQQIKIFYGQSQSVEIRRATDSSIITIPMVTGHVVIQVSEFDGVPAEIYTIDMEYK